MKDLPKNTKQRVIDHHHHTKKDNLVKRFLGFYSNMIIQGFDNAYLLINGIHHFIFGGDAKL